ncbi:MAG TPA: alkaline phosphatase family protein [Longimicrobium sp.]|nr:alkaline phosphatase family protein [Longimicrobium sp.]
MATQRTATVNISNESGGNARIVLFHSNSSNGSQRGAWNAAPGETVGPLTVHFETDQDSATILDHWSVLLCVRDGMSAGIYVSTGTTNDPFWTECPLQHADAGQVLTLSVSSTSFHVSLASGGCEGGMTRLARYSPVTHVFVVMLENHSFDNMLAMSGIPGIRAATPANSNTYQGHTYAVQTSAPLAMPTDPGHEFPDVLEQLAGHRATYPPGGPYPPIDNSGFASSYATSKTEGPGVPAQQEIVDVMACFATPTQLPVLHQLATEFAVCDQWFSSLPGPTWPNRFFLHGASSSGLDASPTTKRIIGWELPLEGFRYPNGSIYDALKRAGIPYRFYNDSTGFPCEQSLFSDDPQCGSPVGAVPQVSSLSGVTLAEIESVRRLGPDLQGPYPYLYTFIEPHYGNLAAGTYAGGSSQHPMDDVYGGEHLLASVYSAIRNSPYWETSLLVVTYDEHGGLYDSVAPPPAPAPGDDAEYGYNLFGFDFKQYGVRVPAVVVSPLVARGTVDHTLYDHASVPRTLEDLFGLEPLTRRDASANSLRHLASLPAARTDCPTSLLPPAPPLKAAKPPATPETLAARDAEPVPQEGNLVGALQALRKADHEVSGGTPLTAAAAQARHAAVQTRGDARAYAAEVMAKVGVARQQAKAAAARTS